LSKFDRTTGTVVLDQAAKTASVDIVIDTTSVNTGYATFNEHIQAPDFLDTAKFPTATFKSTKVDFAGDKPTAIHGNLTIKGVTKPVTFKVTHFVSMPHPMLKKDAIGADASAVIKRSEFNAGKYAPNVGDEVTISVALEAVKQ
jgi:polyisoprenoid-binding protein YceI